MRLLVFVAVTAGLVSTGCSRDPKARLARYVESGKRYMEKKDYSRAVIQFNNARRLNRKDAETCYQLGLAYLELRDLRKALGYLHEAITINPKHAAAQLKFSQILLTSRDKEAIKEAEKHAEEALSMSKNDPDTLGAVALAELKLGKSEDAEAHLEQALEKMPTHLNSSKMLALLKLSRKDTAGAEAVIKEAVERAPNAPEPALALARIYGLSGRMAEAEVQLRRAIQIDPQYGPALADLGAIKLRQNKPAEAEQFLKRLSELAKPEYRQLKHAYALYLAQSGRMDAAIAEFARLAKADPADRQARSRLVSACVRAGKVADAEKVLAEALRENSKDTQALLEQASLYLVSGKPTEAQASLTQLLRIKPENGQAHHLMGRTYAMLGQPARHRDELNEALRHEPRLLAARLELARLHVMTGSPKTALDVLKQAPEEQKNNLGYVVQRNWALLAAGDRAEAKRVLSALPAAARVPEVLLQDALIKLDEKDLNAARPLLAEVLKRTPEDMRALGAMILANGGERSLVALGKLREHAAQYPKSAALQYVLGRVLVGNGKLVEARLALSAAISLNPKSSDAALLLAQIDVAERKPDSARAILKRVLENRPNHSAARLLMGNLEEITGNLGAAIEQYRTVLAAEPRNVLALNNLAYLLADHLRQPDEALRHAQQAAEIAPDSPAIQDTLGWIYYLKGLYGTALPHLEKAAGAEGAGARRKYHLAMAYLKMGQDERGRQTLDRALAMDPNLPEASVAKQLLIRSR